MYNKRPKIGQIIDLGVRGLCRIFKVRPAGTVDVQSIKTGECWRISGLSF